LPGACARGPFVGDAAVSHAAQRTAAEVYLATLVFIAANLIMGLLISTLVTPTLAVVRFRRRLD